MNSIEGLVQQVQELTELSGKQVGIIDTLTREKLAAEARAFEVAEGRAAEVAALYDHIRRVTGQAAPVAAMPTDEDVALATVGKVHPDDFTSKGRVCDVDYLRYDGALVRAYLAEVAPLHPLPAEQGAAPQQQAQAAEQTGTRKIGVTEDGLAALSGAGHSPLPLTDEQVIGVLHSCGIDTYPSVNGFASLQVSATSIVWVREVVRRCMALVTAPVAAAAQGDALVEFCMACDGHGARENDPSEWSECLICNGTGITLSNQGG